MVDIDNVTNLLSKTKVENTNELSFAGRKLKLDTADDAQEIVDAIRSCKDLQALRLEGNTLGVDAAFVIAEALKEKKEFERALWSDMYTGRLRAEIPPSLEHLGNGIIFAKAKLTILDLSDNAFGPDGVKGIEKLLASESCYSLKTLKLNNNGLGIGGGKILSKAFISCYNSSKACGAPFALRVFISGRNRLENEGAKALSEAFKLLGSLEEITMPQNGIRPEGVADLCNAFNENKNLKIVNINDNTCTESGAKALSKCLPNLAKLEKLNIGDCLLKDAGAVVLASALSSEMPNLNEVNMSYNEIRADGAIAIANSMKNKDSLEMLDLDGNHLGEAIDEVQRVMGGFGRASALTPFDDNMEPDSDEDDEATEDDDEADESKDSQLDQDKLMEVSDMKSFLKSPNAKDWERISKSHRKSLLATVIKEDLLPSTEKVAKAFVEVCFTLSEDDEAVADVSDVLLSGMFTDDRCKDEDIISSLLIHMGLIKSEVKVEKVYDLKGPLSGLKSVILKNYFPRSCTPYFISFLMKANGLLDRCQSERHSLLQALYQK